MNGKPPGGWRSWYVVGVLSLAYICSFIDRSVLGLMVGPIREDLGISDTQFSLLHGFAFAIFYTLLGIPIAWLADRASRRNIIAAGIAVWSLMTALCGLARTFGAMFLARVGVGVGEAALSPAAYSMIADLFPREKLGRALGVYSSGVFVGIGLSFIIAAVLIGALDTVTLPVVGELTPWRLTLILVGMPGLVIAALCFTFREPRRLGAKAGGVPLRQVGRFFGQNASLYLLHFIAFSMLTLLFNAQMTWLAEYLIRIHGMERGAAGPALGLIVTFLAAAASSAADFTLTISSAAATMAGRSAPRCWARSCCCPLPPRPASCPAPGCRWRWPRRCCSSRAGCSRRPQPRCNCFRRPTCAPSSRPCTCSS